MQPNQIKRAVEALEHERSAVKGIWQDIERYVVPYRGRFYEPQKDENEFSWFRPARMDDTAVDAADTLSSMLQAKLTPAAYQWFTFRFNDDELNENKTFMEWLEALGTFAFQELQDSNFDEAVGEFYQDFCSYHTAYFGREVVSERDWKGWAFQGIPLKEGFSVEDSHGRLIQFFRKREYTLLQLVERFGEDALPDTLAEKWKQQRDRSGYDTEKHTVLFAVWKRRPGEVEGTATSRAVPPKKRPYGYRFIMAEGLHPLTDEGGYYTMPVYKVMYKKSVGSRFGHGPAMVAMSNIKTLNRLVYLYDNQLEKNVDPPSLTTEDNFLTDMDLTAGGMSVVEDIDGVRPYLSGARLDYGINYIDRLRESIRKTFHIDDLDLKESPAMTATEVAARQRKSQEILASPVSAAINRLFKPLLNDMVADLLRAGQGPEMPQELQGQEFKIEYSGSAALAQKNDIVSGIERTVGTAAGLAEVFPEIMDRFDPDTIAETLGDLNGAPAKIYRSDGETEEIRKQRAEAQAAAAKAEQDKAQAAAMKDQAVAVKTVQEGQGAGLAEVLGGMG